MDLLRSCRFEFFFFLESEPERLRERFFGRLFMMSELIDRLWFRECGDWSWRVAWLWCVSMLRIFINLLADFARSSFLVSQPMEFSR
jgi:hypothetical protein